MSPSANHLPREATLLVTGASGLLGGEVLAQAVRWPNPGFSALWGTWHRQPRALPGAQGFALDVTDRSAVFRLIEQLKPDAIVHTAYLKDGPLAREVTARGSSHVAEAAAATGARLVHVSSDVIFDGEHAPYDEAAPPAPVHPYGEAKAEAEAEVKRLAPQAAIVRTSLINRLDPPDRVTAWIVDSLRTGTPITLFTDEIRNPVWVDDLATALLELALNDFAGVINVAGTQSLSRYEMGERLAHHLALDASTIRAGLSLSSDLPRPRNCTLDVRLAQRLLHTPLRSYDEGLGACCYDHQPKPNAGLWVAASGQASHRAFGRRLRADRASRG